MTRTAAERRILAGTYTVTVLRPDMPQDADPADVISEYTLTALNMLSALTAAKQQLAPDEELVEIVGPEVDGIVTGMSRTEEGRWEVWADGPDEQVSP